jgi:hypothetical protein
MFVVLLSFRSGIAVRCGFVVRVVVVCVAEREAPGPAQARSSLQHIRGGTREESQPVPETCSGTGRRLAVPPWRGGRERDSRG